MARIDWTILQGYLRLEYFGRLPLLGYTPTGLALEIETMTEELRERLRRMADAPIDLPFLESLKDAPRETLWRLLDEIEVTGMCRSSRCCEHGHKSPTKKSAPASTEQSRSWSALVRAVLLCWKAELRRRPGSFCLPLLGPRPSGSDAFMHFGWCGRRFLRLFLERTQGGDVLAVLLAAALIGPAIFAANQRLRRPDSLGRVGHVQAMTLDLPVQMLPAILSHAEAMSSSDGIVGECL